jgi:ribosomal protein S18 acetylase RimI-like enzyme
MDAYRSELASTASVILPILGFTHDETSTFIRTTKNTHPSTISMEYESPAGEKAFLGGRRRFEYLIPSSWEDRFTIARAALKELIEASTDLSPGGTIDLTVDEGVPSHCAWLGALLPELGFHVVPRIEFRADHSLVDNLVLPDLPPDYLPLPYQESHFDLFADAFTRIAPAAGGNGELYDPETLSIKSKELEPFNSFYAYEESTVELRKNIWMGVLHNQEIVGYSFCDIWRKGRQMIILELAVAHEHWGKGIGRYLTTRCMQNMKSHYGRPDSYFSIGTQRDNIRARDLYYRLGFSRDTLSTRASYSLK